MEPTAYEQAYLAHLQADLAFRKEQEAAEQKRHEEREVYSKNSISYGQHDLALRLKIHQETMAAEAADTAAKIRCAEAQVEAARIFANDTRRTIVELAIARINDRTGTTSTPDIPRSVREVLEVFNETDRQLNPAAQSPGR